MTQDQPLVSVLMTAYNRQAFIAEAIESVLASTYPHFELIIVDDGSKDDTVSIAYFYGVRLLFPVTSIFPSYRYDPKIVAIGRMYR